MKTQRVLGVKRTKEYYSVTRGKRRYHLALRLAATRILLGGMERKFHPLPRKALLSMKRGSGPSGDVYTLIAFILLSVRAR